MDAMTEDRAALEARVAHYILCWEGMAENPEPTIGLLRDVAALLRERPNPQPESENWKQDFIDHILAHWFTQGGASQFGAIECGTCHNPDEVVLAILQCVRSGLRERPAQDPAHTYYATASGWPAELATGRLLHSFEVIALLNRAAPERPAPPIDVLDDEPNCDAAVLKKFDANAVSSLGDFREGRPQPPSETP